VAGQEYQIYYKDELQEVFWNPIGGVLIGTGNLLGFTNAIGSGPQRFFRVGVLPESPPLPPQAPTLGNIRLEADEMSFGWFGQAGQQYQVYSRDHPSSGAWDTIGPPLDGDGAPLRFAVPVQSASQQFFRVAIVL
jgi:hypothetical protein